MKWIILVLLMSCGHEAPPAKDIADSDGDHIPNYLETSGVQKYVAEIIPLGEIRGTLSVKLIEGHYTVEFANDEDVQDRAMRLLTKSPEALKIPDYFSEFSRLELSPSLPVNFKEDILDVSLLLRTSERSGYVFLVDEKSETLLGSLAARMSFQLKGAELTRLITKKARLEVRRSEVRVSSSAEENIRARTYRVYIHDGTGVKIHYVSKDLAFSDYLRESGINEHFELKSVKGFIGSEVIPFWWTRSLPQGDKVLYKGSLKSISDFHQTNFHKGVQVISRENGAAKNILTVSKAPKTKFVLRLRGHRVKRTFSLSEKRYTIGGGRGEVHEDCKDWRREITSEASLPITKDDYMNEILVESTDKTMPLLDLRENLTQGQDEKGPYLELALDETPERFTLRLSSRAAGTFTQVGVYQSTCRGVSYSNLNDEAQMIITAETYIEKID